ncbi:MAG TPA: methionine adenosyltransferase [Gemmatimonadaceae bacterium]|nr:methionine adenosyltransferase [Gemmatimonadaceae bacterium]
MELIVRAREGQAAGSQPVEVVERKGLGHPDTICDAVAERVSIELSRYYRTHFDAILHHNVDKVLLCGGSSRVTFGGGEILEPIEIYLAGRATSEYRAERIPVHDIAIAACRAVLQRHVRELDVDADVRITSKLRPGSADLRRLYDKSGTVPHANDTSCGVGFFPLTDLERVVLAVERELTDSRHLAEHPEIGEDVKVMGVRRDHRIDITVGCAFIARHVRDIREYASKKDDACTRILAAARRVTDTNINVVINAADDLSSGDVFITVTGTSAESGDDGEVGRGNRVSGLITPYRISTMEAAAGKNPVSHVGKLYNIVARRVAESIVTGVPNVSDATCALVSQIGRSVTDPHIADIQLGINGGRSFSDVWREVADVVRTELERLPALRDALLDGTVPVF